MKNNKGFISVSIIYSFFLVFIAIVIGMVAMYVNRRILINAVEEEIRESFPNSCLSEGITLLNECILFSNGGAENILTLNTTWEELEPVDTDVAVWKRDDYWFGTSYTFDSETGEYTLSGELVQATLEECRNGTKSCGEYTLRGSTQDYKGRTLHKIISFTSSTCLDSNDILCMRAQNVTAKNIFSEATTESDAGLYKMQDDLGDSYYFRGNVRNNYVMFAGFVWRIVRINGDGTIRLVYDGTGKVANGSAHTATIGSTAYNEDVANVNYRDSDIKNMLDTWYYNHLKQNYEGYIADGIFCNDKEVLTTAYYIGYTCKSGARLGENRMPVLTCARKEDRYTLDANLGNGLLDYPIGLLTADEIALAGGLYGGNDGALLGHQNTSFYLYSGEYFWTSTPLDCTNFTSAPSLFALYGSGLFWQGSHNFSYGARPVINLKVDVPFTGSGTIDNPYVVGMV